MAAVHHIVLIKLKPGVERADPRLVRALDTLLALKDKISGIVRWEHGWNFAQSPRAYDFALDSTFESRTAFDAYGPHPEHQAAAAQLREVADWVLCDFEGRAG